MRPEPVLGSRRIMQYDNLVVRYRKKTAAVLRSSSVCDAVGCLEQCLIGELRSHHVLWLPNRDGLPLHCVRSTTHEDSQMRQP
jgi:hypothetical protein